MKILLLLILALIMTGAAAPPAKYKPKVPVVDAIQWDGANLAEITAFMAPSKPIAVDPTRPNAINLIHIDTPEGRATATASDWIIKLAPGVFAVQTNAEFTLKNEAMP